MNEALKKHVCEICGGELKELEEGHYQCPYCRTEFFKETTLPDELVLDLHSANRERSLQRFEDALNEYDRIIESYPECFDAYWGATLSDYGIQYEKDYDGRMIPTVHRFSEVSVFENDYFVNAQRYCKNENEKARIEKSAAEIERIRTEIKKTVGTQKPYDIFLCYKETPIDNPRDYTPEYYWASELYIKLRGEGYKVFFAKESLPAAKGDYEAHIFPALRSAKLMLILTTSPEHVESVWVKNEWSRFIRFSRENPAEGKRFKVIYRGFKPEKLPRELRKEQALSQDSLGWVAQLNEVLKDTFRDKEKEEAERKKRESEEQAARFARMLEEERKKWAAEEQKRQQEEKARREAEELKKQQEEKARREAEELKKQQEEKARREAEELKKQQEKAKREAEELKTQQEEEKKEFKDYKEEIEYYKQQILANSTPPKENEEVIYRDVIIDSSKDKKPAPKETEAAKVTVSEGKANNSTEKKPKKEAEDPNEPKIGDIVKFGKYRQSDKNDSLRVIDWQILDKKDGKALVISKFALTTIKFQEEFGVATWETCTLRKWLNSEFLNNAFSAEEIAAIPTVTVSAHKNPMYESNSGKPTEDKVFLLSAKEANTYFKNPKKAICKPTTYAQSKGAKTNIDGKCRWWLRTIGEKSGQLAYVSFFGDVQYRGESNNSTSLAVRPAMWIDLHAIKQEDKKTNQKTEGTVPFTDAASLDGYVEAQLKDGFYKGEFKDGKPHGKGELKYKTDNLYKGDFINGLPHGNGTMKYSSGTGVYVGEWSKGLRHVTGKVKEGEFKNGVFKTNKAPSDSASDTKTAPSTSTANTTDNAKNTPSPEKDDKTGEKKCITKMLPSGFYTGWAVDDVPNGIGEMKYHNGYVYHGDFLNGKRHGKGKMIYCKSGRIQLLAEGEQLSGDVYEGEWAYDQRHGKGKQIYQSGSVYEGYWKDDAFHGQGKCIHDNGDIYEGHYIKGKRSGKGKYTFKNGDVYEGEWLDGLEKGFGKLTYATGEVYEGEWVLGEKNGKGKYTYANGDVFTGVWEKDQPIGKGIMTYKNGKTAKGKIVDGVFKKTLF